MSEGNINGATSPKSHSKYALSKGSFSQWKPTEDQILQYCEFLGMDLEQDSHLKYIAADALTAPIPPPWKEYETPDGYVYYVHTKTGKSSWEHPLDGFYKDMYYEAKKETSGKGSTKREASRQKIEIDTKQAEAKERELEELRKEMKDLKTTKNETVEEVKSLRVNLLELKSFHEKEIQSIHETHEKQTAKLQKQRDQINLQIESLTKQHQAELENKGQSVEVHLKQAAEERERANAEALKFQQQILELTEQLGQAKVDRLEISRLRKELGAKDILIKEAENRAKETGRDYEKQVASRERKIEELGVSVKELGVNLERIRQERDDAKSGTQDLEIKIKGLKEEVLGFQNKCGALEVEIKRGSAAMERSEQRCSYLENQLSESKSENNQLSLNLDQVKKERQDFLNKVEVLQKITSAGLHEDHQKCIKELTVVAVKCKEMDIEVTQARKELGLVKDNLEALQGQVHKVEIERREALNKLQDLQGNIRVMCRVRPLLSREKQTLKPQQANPVTCASSTGGVTIQESNKEHDFKFNHVFSDTDQPGVFSQVENLVMSALDGYNVCLFAYGQTGSGKTFTMQGEEAKLRGIIPRAVQKILDVAERKKVQGWEFEIEGSYLEIYNEQVRDLLVRNSSNLDIKLQDAKKGQIATYVPGLQKKRINCMDDMDRVVDTAGRNRSVASTDMNLHSSRSHSVFTLYLKGKNLKQRVETHSALYLCDLAGSERIAKSGVEGARLKEAVMINKSLSALSDVFQAIARGDKHIPFRNSKLTYLLQCCFVGNGKTLMFVNLSPNPNSAHESLCSLRFAQKVNQCVMGPASANAHQLAAPKKSASTRNLSPAPKLPPGKPRFMRATKGTRRKAAKKYT